MAFVGRLLTSVRCAMTLRVAVKMPGTLFANTIEAFVKTTH